MHRQTNLPSDWNPAMLHPTEKHPAEKRTSDSEISPTRTVLSAERSGLDVENNTTARTDDRTTKPIRQYLGEVAAESAPFRSSEGVDHAASPSDTPSQDATGAPPSADATAAPSTLRFRFVPTLAIERPESNSFNAASPRQRSASIRRLIPTMLAIRRWTRFETHTTQESLATHHPARFISQKSDAPRSDPST